MRDDKRQKREEEILLKAACIQELRRIEGFEPTAKSDVTLEKIDGDYVKKVVLRLDDGWVGGPTLAYEHRALIASVAEKTVVRRLKQGLWEFRHELERMAGLLEGRDEGEGGTSDGA